MDEALRVGVIGTDNTHGFQFTSFLNGWREDVAIPVRSPGGELDSSLYLWAMELREEAEARPPRVPVPGARVTRAWSAEPREAELLRRAAGVEHLCDDPAEACEDVDAVMVLTGDPATHAELARPALERGLPTFVDKPIAATVEGCHELYDLAEAHGAALWTTSGLRYARAFHLARRMAEERIGALRGIYVQCPLTWDQYGIHCVEAANVFVGHDAVAVSAARAGDRVVGAVELRSGVTAVLETIGFFGAPEYNVTLYGEHGNWFVRRTQGDRSLVTIVERFVAMARTGEPPTPRAEVLAMVSIADRVQRAADGQAPDGAPSPAVQGS